MKTPLNKAIALVCKQLKVRKNDIVKVQYQSQGWSNNIFLVVLKNGARYIARIAGKSTLKNRQIEMKVLDVLTKVNFFKITYLNKNNGDYIYPYIEGHNISFKDVKDFKFLKLLAKKLKDLHSIKLDKNLSLEENDYYQYDQYSKNIDQKYTLLYHQLLKKYKDLKKCLCHNDLTQWNMIYNKSKQTLSFIDFEWSRINTPYFDLTNFIREANIHNTKYEKYLVSQYNKKFNLSTITDFLYISSYFSYLWTYSTKSFQHILHYRNKMLRLLKKFYGEIK